MLVPGGNAPGLAALSHADDAPVRRHPGDGAAGFQDVAVAVAEDVGEAIVSRRLAQLALNEDSPILGGYVSEAAGWKVFDQVTVGAVTKEGAWQEALALIEQYGVTHSQWVPTMFVRMLKLPEETRRRHDLSSHRVAIHAAAPCPRQVKRAMIEWWGPIVQESYAGSEGNGLCAINSADWLAHEGSVGRPVFGMPPILDAEGRDLPPGQEGTLYFPDGTLSLIPI